MLASRRVFPLCLFLLLLLPAAAEAAQGTRHDMGPVRQVAVTRTGSCLVVTAGALHCWGWEYGARRQPLRGPEVQRVFASSGWGGICTSDPAGKISCDRLPAPSWLRTQTVAVGSYQACAVDQTEHLLCWDDGASAALSNPPTLGTIKAVAAGYQASCAIRSDDTLACWGEGTAAGQFLAVPSGLGTVKTVSVGYSAICAIRSNDTLACWGGLPQAPQALTAVREVAVGEDAACALPADQAAGPVCWGRGGAVTQVPAGLAWGSDLHVGNGHACLNDGAGVRCWGADEHGQVTSRSSWLKQSAPWNALRAPRYQRRTRSFRADLRDLQWINETLSVRYNWQLSRTGRSGWKPLRGTSPNHRVTRQERGRFLRVCAVGSNLHGRSTTICSAAVRTPRR